MYIDYFKDTYLNLLKNKNTKKLGKVSFKGFLAKFPVVELPVTLGNDSHHIFSKNNTPLNSIDISEYILSLIHI